MCGPSALLPTRVLLLSVFYLLRSLANKVFTWAEKHSVSGHEALKSYLQWRSLSGMNH